VAQWNQKSLVFLSSDLYRVKSVVSALSRSAKYRIDGGIAGSAAGRQSACPSSEGTDHTGKPRASCGPWNPDLSATG
jgi:hypothetical protein